LPLKNKNPKPVPWQLTVDDSNYQEQPWQLKKGKSHITIQKDKSDRSNFHLQKDNERVLSLQEDQAQMTYHQLIEFGYKLQKRKQVPIKEDQKHLKVDS